MHPGVLHRRFLTDLSTSLFTFVLPLLPTNEELTVKEEVRGLIEKLIWNIEPSARLLSFGSSCNSFGLRNSDMDLVVLIDDENAGLDPSHLVQMMGDLLERETNFVVKPLPKARIPILKLTLAPSPALPFGISCDIGIENRLAIENTRLLLTYATIDPARVRTLVLFLKVWAKRRRINSPYRGTLSSYGFTLMVLYYLVHVKQPPVLPNLQRIAPITPLAENQVMLEGRNVYFFDDVETLRREWSSINFETVGELLIDFFRFFSHDFQFNNSVLSLRAGPLTKESKGWVNDIDVGGMNENARDRNRLCIEDPFEVSYNVARTVTKDGLYTLRGEFMRATRILTQRPDRAILALNELCREGDDELQRAPRSNSPAPRAMSQPRGGYPAQAGSAAFRSQSQLPFDRFNPPAYDNGRRGRQSEGSVAEHDEVSAQEQWLASQGPNLGNMGSLGLGFPEGFDGQGQSGRGRDTSARGLENPGGPYGHGRRSTSKFNHDDPGTGSISAPLSPHRLYAQLEMGKGPASGWPAYEPRQGGLSVPSPSGGPSSYTNPNPNAGRSTSSSHVAPGSGAPPSRSASSSNSNSNGSGNPNKPQEAIALSSFQPFSPPIPTSKLRHMKAGESSMTSFISPSTLLSPPQAAAPLPAQTSTVDSLVNDFGKMGVVPVGKNAENDQKAKGTKGKGGRTTPGWQNKATSPDPSKGSS